MWQSLNILVMSRAVVYLSFWAEVHYNSIYPQGGNFSFLSPDSIKCFKLEWGLNGDLYSVVCLKYRLNTSNWEQIEELCLGKLDEFQDSLFVCPIC